MRKVSASLFISLDNVVEAPDQWQFDGFNEEMMAEMGKQIGVLDTVLMGRQTYEEWAGYFPTSQDEPFASFINKVPKYVASTTLKTVAWGDFDSVKLLQGNPVDAINALKQQSGSKIGVTGSPSLVRWLLANNLLDELLLQIHPVLVGHGKRLFKDADTVKRLKLTESRTTKTGIIMVSYEVQK